MKCNDGRESLSAASSLCRLQLNPGTLMEDNIVFVRRIYAVKLK